LQGDRDGCSSRFQNKQICYHKIGGASGPGRRAGPLAAQMHGPHEQLDRSGAGWL
jgi:hypothetical protein